MKLPVDVKAVIEEATSIDRARTTALSVSVYIDDTAPGDVQALVRQAFASASPHARVSIIYADGRPIAPYAGDDMACIVAGLSPEVGAHAAALRAAGVPAMVVTTMPQLAGAIASSEGSPIPAGDLLAPRLPRAHAEEERARAASGVRAGVEDIGAHEPIELDAAAIQSLSDRMGGWVVDACREKRLAFALAFPFVRKPLALETVNSTALQNAGVGLVVIIPGADLPVMTLNQAKMLLMIAAAYGEEMDLGRVKELAALVGGAFACRSVARQLVAFVPALGWAVKAAIGYGGTAAMGRAAIEYYEGGTNVARLAEAVACARDRAVRSAAKSAAQKARSGGAAAAGAVRAKAAQAAGSVRSGAAARFGRGTAGEEASA